MSASELPPIKLDHLKALTDDTGILQHVKFTTPRRREGYTTDDNARALIACVKYYQISGDPEIEKLVDIYLSFLFHMQRSDGKFHNLLSYDRRFLDDAGSEDCMGRAIWACGYTINSNLAIEKRLASKEIFDKGLPWALNLKSPRAKAFTILGLNHYQKAYPEDHNLTLNIEVLTNQLLDNYRQASSPDWLWFEPYLTYANARLPQALFEACSTTGNNTYLKIGEETFNFLTQNLIIDGVFFPIGNKGWYKKDCNRTSYDQQPIEASCTLEAAITAFRVTFNEEYLDIARIAFDWFLGKNCQKAEIYNPKTGGCYDGITPQGVNLNQGTEATISYLLARLEFDMASHLS